MLQPALEPNRLRPRKKRSSSRRTVLAIASVSMTMTTKSVGISRRRRPLRWRTSRSILVVITLLCGVVVILCDAKKSTKAEPLPLTPASSSTSTADVAESSLVLPSSYSDNDDDNADENPLWPSGISNEDVERLVEEVAGDPRFNIAAIPDPLERSIYKSVIRLVFNAIYRSLGNLHGQKLMGHQFKIYRWKGFDASGDRIDEMYLSVIRGDISEDILDETVTRLLSNKAINQRFVPDAIERRLYHNCLKLVFRIIGMIAASLRVTVCGHEIGLDINRAEILQPAVQRVAISLRAINKAKIEELAAQVGYQGVDDMAATDCSGGGNGWMKQMMDRRRQALLVKLHATLWGLILGIIDDLLASTRIELLSDRISMDIVPSPDPKLAKSRRSLRRLVSRGLIMSMVFTPIVLVAADRFL